MALGLMQPVLTTESVLPCSHPPRNTQNPGSSYSREVMLPSQLHLEDAETVVQPSDIEVQVGRSHTKVTSGFYSTGMGNRALHGRELLGRSGSGLTSVHLSSVAVKLSSFCCFFWRKAGSESKGHLLLCFSLQTHQSRAEALISLSLDGEAFPLLRFLHLAVPSLCQTSCCLHQHR